MAIDVSKTLRQALTRLETEGRRIDRQIAAIESPCSGRRRGFDSRRSEAGPERDEPSRAEGGRPADESLLGETEGEGREERKVADLTRGSADRRRTCLLPRIGDGFRDLWRCPRGPADVPVPQTSDSDGE